MSQILNKVQDVDPNNSEAIKEALTAYFRNLSKHTDSDCMIWLHTLESAINRFPKYCMTHRNTIETYLTQFLDSNNYYYVIEAAKCAHVLQQVRPSYEKTATPKTCWRDQMATLCNAVHTLISVVFPHAVDIHNRQPMTDLQSPSSPLTTALWHITNVKPQSDQTNKHTMLSNRLRNVFVFIQAMLVEIYPVAKPVRPQTILDVIVRALSVSSGNIDRDIANVVMAKTEALRILDALVACLGSNLVPFSPLLFRFVMQTLKWSSEHPCKESSKVRCVAYCSLGQWLSTLRVHSSKANASGWQDELTAFLLDDITPYKHTIQLTVNSHPTKMKNISKKARRKLANTMLQQSSISSHMPGEKNKIDMSEETSDEVAISALKCAETFLTVCGIFLKPAIHKQFQDRLVRECHLIPTYSKQRGLSLLRALSACHRAAPPTVPPPAQYCLQLYSVFVNSHYNEIADFCTRALQEMRLKLHHSPPSLNFALEVEQQKPEDTKKKVSEKNREALAALLGVDKIPTPTLPVVEIVNVTDEPLSKRPRLEESTDQISVSSDSDMDAEVEIVNEEANVDNVIDNITETDGIVTVDDEDALDNALTQQLEVTSINVDDQNGKNNEINSQIEEKIVSVYNIYEARTQLPINVPNEDKIGKERSPSLEVTYDYPNSGKEELTVLQKVDDENLPSTNDTDDIQITCGQVVKSSQDNVEKKSDEIPKENGVSHNGTSDEDVALKEKAVDGLKVEEMMADFVDEVIEEVN